MSFLTNLMRKDSPTVQSVHISSALGNDRYSAALARRKAKRKQVGKGDMEVLLPSSRDLSGKLLPLDVAAVARAEIAKQLPASKANIAKAQDVAVNFVVPITKFQEDKNRVFGWASVIEENGETVIDVQDDWIAEHDLEEALYDFAKNARCAGEMHGEARVGQMIECVAFTKEKQDALGIDLGRVGAWIGFEVTPAVFAKARSGELGFFSIGGSGRRIQG